MVRVGAGLVMSWVSCCQRPNKLLENKYPQLGCQAHESSVDGVFQNILSLGELLEMML